MGRVKKTNSPERKLGFSPSGDYERWTNTFSRSTVHWDKGNELLDQEKGNKRRFTATDRCCGNSPNKSHTKVHDTTMMGERTIKYSAN